MVCLSRCLDRAWLAGLGLLAACPPLPHSEPDTAGETTQDGTTAPDPTTPPTTTITTITTDPPGCEPGSSCGFCSYCDDNGACLPEVSCCARHGLDAARCQPPAECYGDDDCPSGEVCDDEHCVPAATLPPCGPAAVAVQWDMSQTPTSFGLADLDGDGSLDLFAPIPSLAAVELAYNDGAGNFATGTLVELGEPQTELRAAAGDLDGDGDLDLAVARPDAGDLILVFGQFGKFLAGPSLPASAPPRSVTVADIDLDGAADLLAIGDLGSVSLWYGDGLGGFSTETFTPNLVASVNARVVAIDLDGVPDILTVPDDRINLYFGGPNSPWTHSRTLLLDEGGWSHALAGDLGGEPNPEIVAVRGELDGGGLAHVWRGLKNSYWDTPASIYLTDTPLLGGRLVDVTHDGRRDLVSATGTASVVVLVGDGAGGFACEQVHPLAASTSPDLLATGDLDGDGRTDIVAGAPGSPALTVLTVP
jgi:hypothetical protein